LNFASLGVDDPIGHRLDTWGVGYRAAHIRLVTVLVLDDLCNCIYMRGFGDRLHESIVSLKILIVNPHRSLNTVLGSFYFE
jgi:hypothetical protein